MKIGIICADDNEVIPVIEAMEVTKITEKAMLKFYEGKLCGKDVVALYCGVCRVNAAIGTQLLIDMFNVDIVINEGVAGGIDPEVKVFDTVVSTEVTYRDIQEGVLTDYHPWMKSEWFKSDERLVEIMHEVASSVKTKGTIRFGKTLTSEHFVDDEGRDEIISRFDPLSVDMETAGMAHVCYVNEVPFISIRSITDTAEHSGSANYEENLQEAVLIVRDIVMEFIKRY
ncbi:MAG: 5'-methylthioadenosine/adenosylhomocysteine nucleosidase [Clostridiales bacterium]|nr:5'-methylthioadenosine/adenosylhomocysteine nucleosidase [Clostridiales bacterium]